MSSPDDISAGIDSLDALTLTDSALAELVADSTGSPAPDETHSLNLRSARTADECVEIAARAEEQGNTDLKREALERAVALDRNNQAALLMLAATSLDAGDPGMTFTVLEETARAGLLPDNVVPLHQELAAQAIADDRLASYLKLIGRMPGEKTSRPLSILVLTNLFPPQELGGYGRMMWEFARGLHARGHHVRVLTSDAANLAKPPVAEEADFEQHVTRSLQLLGNWDAGRALPLRDPRELNRRIHANVGRIQAAVTDAKAEIVLAGNLDFLGITSLRAALDKVPVLHALANAGPGYTPADQPADSHYWVAPCSNWNGEAYRAAGYIAARIETLYPGARVDRFFRFFLPDTERLRICFASLLLPYKGADTLVQALIQLHQAGIDFTAEIAGDAPDTSFATELRTLVARHGLSDRICFTGFLDRNGLSALFARSNVLVFPSRFQEPFGISQVEALAAGLVVVSSGTGGAKEIVRDGIDGLLFAAGDASGLAQKLALLARHPGVFGKLQRYGQARASAFSVDLAVRKIESLAAELVGFRSVNSIRGAAEGES